ncbi:hypothetical protein SAMN05443667_1132 [Flavobacterium gillisiae]|uniref:PLD-like domain-containing protein n=1 Tax=Flavobacterium gillisiae TaxID=150146 RepID=A0A1H4FCX7_9FLAO|nr:phospholipase D family protein [Flavobacterium gillisiae]SEA94887.1 hypothetical protein SAMN05443667_1132 [Flavobacterium gillisiae]
MAEFLTGKALDEKLTDIIWEAKKELIILSPFIRLDDYCKSIFKKLKNNPELEVIIVFGKNEGETQRSLTPSDLEIFKEFSNITIIYCNNLHAKYYANESEALLTSLNLLGKSMTGNVEYGICFQNSKLNLDKLYTDSYQYTNSVITDNPCVFVKLPIFKKTNLGLSRKYVESRILYDMTDALYRNRDFEKKYFNDFDTIESDNKPSREEFVPEEKTVEKKQYSSYTPKNNYNRRNQQAESGFCIRTGEQIPFDPRRPYCYEAYQTWAIFENWNYRENYCHKTGRESNGRTSMSNPIL